MFIAGYIRASLSEDLHQTLAACWLYTPRLWSQYWSITGLYLAPVLKRMEQFLFLKKPAISDRKRPSRMSQD